MFNDEAKMRELVVFDPDVPPAPRWAMYSVMFPDAAMALVRRYGTKQEQKDFKKLFGKQSE